MPNDPKPAEVAAKPRAIKIGVKTLQELHAGGFISYPASGATVTVAKLDAEGNVSELTDVRITALVGMTDAALVTFVNNNDPNGKAKAKLLAAIKELRSQGFSDLANQAEAKLNAVAVVNAPPA